MSGRGLVAGSIAVAALVVAGVLGATASSGPGELACESVGVSANEQPRSFRTPTAAAAAHAVGLLPMEADAIVEKGGVVDVTGSANLRREPVTGTVFAVRDHGRTIAFFTVIRDQGGWIVDERYVC